MGKLLSVKTKKYRVNNISVNVAECGRGKPILLVHGWSNNWVGWTLLARELASKYTVFMIDLPGFGDSGRLSSYSLESEAQIVGGFMNEYVGKSEAVIGASMGTLVSSKSLQMFPHMTKRLILLGAMFHQLSMKTVADVYTRFLRTIQGHEIFENIFVEIVKAPLTAYIIEKYIHAYSFKKEHVDNYMLPGRQKITGKSYVELGVSAASFVLEDVLATLPHPTLVVYGEAEKYVRPGDAKRVVRQLQDRSVQLLFIPRCGHNPASEQPELTAQAIFDFIQK